MLSTSEDQLRTQFLEAAGAGDQAIERVKKISDYAFIHFKDREVAQRCLEKLNGKHFTLHILNKFVKKHRRLGLIVILKLVSCPHKNR